MLEGWIMLHLNDLANVMPLWSIEDYASPSIQRGL
jgi:hypothetical protein